ncbi:MAG: hypothetical protein ACPG5B_05335 [Chitinophagales bacterium]
MLDQIVNLVKEQAVSQFVNQTNVPDEKAEVAAQAAGESIFETIKNQIVSGNVASLTSLLTGGNKQQSSSNPIMATIMSTLTSKLSNNGVNEETAQNASATVVPDLMQQVIGKFMSPEKADAEFNTENLISSVLNNSIQGAVKDQVQKNLGNVLGGFFK